MTFKELFSQFSFAEIRPAFLNLWQTNEPKLVEHLDLDKWERIYQNVQALFCIRQSGQSPRLPYGLLSFVVGNSWYGSGGRKRYRDHATRACRGLAVGNHLLWRDGRDGGRKSEKNIPISRGSNGYIEKTLTN